MDVQLKRRSDLVPNLVETVKGYASHERSTLDRVVHARTAAGTAGTLEARARAEGELGQALRQLFALAEAYPDLKTNQTYIQLQNRISSLENGIADRRELYNESVNVNNVRVEQFPGKIVAGMFGFMQAALLAFDAAEKSDVDVKALFGQ